MQAPTRERYRYRDGYTRSYFSCANRIYYISSRSMYSNSNKRILGVEKQQLENLSPKMPRLTVHTCICKVLHVDSETTIVQYDERTSYSVSYLAYTFPSRNASTINRVSPVKFAHISSAFIDAVHKTLLSGFGRHKQHRWDARGCEKRCTGCNGGLI